MTQLSFSTQARRLAPHLLGLVFGGLWATIAALALAPRYRSVAMALVFLITLGFLLRLWSRTFDLPSQKAFFRTRSYLVAVGCEIAALWITSAMFLRFNLTEFTYSAIGFIVGLHFIGLWKASGSRRFLRICAGMCLVSLLSAILPFRWKMLNLRYVFLGIGNAFVLWIGALGEE